MIITNNNHNKTSVKPVFGNAVMNYLATNQAIGAFAVDMGFMVIPRTTIDFTRTPEAGMETGRRELVSCLLYTGMGFFGLAAAFMVGALKSKQYDVPFHKINAGSSVIDALAHNWDSSLDKNGRDLTNKNAIIEGFLNNVCNSVSGLSGNTKTPINSKPTAQKEIVDKLRDLLLNEKDYKISKDTKSKLVQKIIQITGASEHLSLVDKTAQIEVNGIKQFEQIKLSAGDLLDNVYSLGRTFMQDKVAAEFKKTKNVADNEFIKSLKRFNSHKMLLGIGMVSAVAFSMQSVNRWLTKKKTGSDGFVVYKDKEGSGEKAQKDKSTGFKILKGLAAAAMSWFALSQIGGKLKDLPKKLEFTKLMPNMNHYKYAYGLTIVGRLLASSDKNELRETATRDFLGFASWLVLGDVVAKLAAGAFEKHKGVKLLNCEDGNLKGFAKLMESSLKTHDELLHSDPSKIASEGTKRALKYLNIAQLSGYAYSGLLLGIFIPMLNKAVTNKLHEKEIEKKKAAAIEKNEIKV